MKKTCPTCPTLYDAGMSQHSSRGATWDATRKAVLDRDGWVCTWPECGKHLEGRDATVDHVYPKALGLAMGWTQDEIDAPSNLVAMCRKHNGMKSDQLSVRMDYKAPAWFA